MEELNEVVKKVDEKVLQSYYCICKYYNIKLDKELFEKLSEKLSTDRQER